MDQKQLYERQVTGANAGATPASALAQRETALLNWISHSMARLPNGTAGRIAELSIGDGQLSRALVTKFPSLRIDCIDISPSRLELARRLAGEAVPSALERMRFLELNLDSDFEQLERRAYDCVIAIDVLEHVFDPFHFVRQCHEILSPGGGLFLRVPNLAYLKRRLALIGGRLPVTSSWFETPGSFAAWRERHGWDGGHLHFFTIDALRWLLTEEGFECVSWNDIGASVERLRNLWPGMLFGNIAVFALKATTDPHATAG